MTACSLCAAGARRRRRRREETARDRELRLSALLAERDLTLRQDGPLYDVLEGRALVIDGATLDQLERWLGAVEEHG